MALSQTTDSLISSIRSRCYENVGALSDAKVLRIMNEELNSYLVPFLEAARTDLFTTYVDTAIVANQRDYYIPQAALGSRIRAICIVSADGSITRQLTELDLDALVQGPGYLNVLATGSPTGYYFQGEQIILYPKPISSGEYFRVYYSRTPSELVLEASCQLVSASTDLGGGARQLTVASNTLFSTNGMAVDLVSAKSPFPVLLSSTVTGHPSTNKVNIGTWSTGAAASLLTDGTYYLCVAGQAPVPTGVPAEFWNGLFVQWMVGRLMAARGDSAAYDKAVKDVGAAEARAKLLLRQRNKGDTHMMLSLPYRFKGGYGGFRRSF